MDVWVWTCECTRVGVDVWVWMCGCTWVDVNMRVCTSRCACVGVDVDVWVYTCGCGGVYVDVWMLMCGTEDSLGCFFSGTSIWFALFFRWGETDPWLTLDTHRVVWQDG